jgi:hypothetical protein
MKQAFQPYAYILSNAGCCRLQVIQSWKFNGLPYRKSNTKRKDLWIAFHTLKTSQILTPEKPRRDILFQGTTEKIKVGHVVWTYLWNGWEDSRYGHVHINCCKIHLYFSIKHQILFRSKEKPSLQTLRHVEDYVTKKLGVLDGRDREISTRFRHIFPFFCWSRNYLWLFCRVGHNEINAQLFISSLSD